MSSGRWELTAEDRTAKPCMLHLASVFTMSRYDFIYDLMQNPRTYRLAGGPHDYLMDFDSGGKRIQLSEQNDGNTVAVLAPALADATPGAIEALEQQYDIKLPDDFREFYQRWNGGMIRMLYPYRLLNLSELRQTIDRFTDEVTSPRIVRFCDLDDGNYFALRHLVSAWDVVYAEAGIDDKDLCEARAGNDGWGTDESFEAWLRRIVDTDGWPIVPDGTDEECFDRRIV